MKIKRALVSVSDKTGIVEFAKDLKRHNVSIISTGGTAKAISEAGIDVIKVADVTGFPEILDGRVKTLHPKIHGALLARRDLKSHMDQIAEHEIDQIDLVVVNLYPFQETVEKPGVAFEEAIENIDIGGPSMIRSAAKNMASVAVVVDPARYGQIISEMDENDGEVLESTRRELAKEAFSHTADYDEAIYEYLEGEQGLPSLLKLVFEKVADLRYGENPHQHAAFYRDEMAGPGTLVRADQLHGKSLSFNNILDFDAAWRIANEFPDLAAVVIKHNNPSGVCVSENMADAFKRAFDADSLSAFGSVVAINRPVDAKTAELMVEPFLEGIIAPGFEEEALKILMGKKNLRLLLMPDIPYEPETRDIKRVQGGILVQDADTLTESLDEMKVASTVMPSEDDWRDLVFAWRVAKYVKSNAIVLASNMTTVGVGAGQMSRVDSTNLAVKKAGEKVEGTVLASDAFFPFPDAVLTAAAAGIRAIIQPGGSIRDEEIIAAANKHNIAMVFTGSRHFRH
ncbi:MAG TPA: bifunctional phosphoribosylaminoimidazolecarboxamide formyltransferase/IMP cyclohydrolase [Actinobacteria bacterium]|nr:bifunctional phosphoribosylaminoimidazolecarboxamide formyltransferase/IMP cyclohydrolase [Actinomycetota bacterium]